MGGLTNFFLELASNSDLPDLWLPSTWDYSHEFSIQPESNFIFLPLKRVSLMQLVNSVTSTVESGVGEAYKDIRCSSAALTKLFNASFCCYNFMLLPKKPCSTSLFTIGYKRVAEGGHKAFWVKGGFLDEVSLLVVGGFLMKGGLLKGNKLMKGKELLKENC
jgi:hypothetical protein